MWDPVTQVAGAPRLQDVRSPSRMLSTPTAVRLSTGLSRPRQFWVPIASQGTDHPPYPASQESAHTPPALRVRTHTTQQKRQGTKRR